VKNTEWISLISLVRPFTLLAPVIVSSSVMIASLYFTGQDLLSSWSIPLFIVLASCAFALLNGASNALNQATDIKEDRLSKPYRPLPRGDLTIRQALLVAGVLYSISLFLAGWIHPLFFAFMVLITSFTVSYSVFPRMKKRLVWNQLWVALPRGFLGILASWSVFGNPFDPMVLAIAVLAAVFLFGGTTTKDILDADADKQQGIATLMNTYGIRFTAWASLWCMAAAFLLIIPLIVVGVLPSLFLLLVLLLIPTIYIWWSMMHAEKLAHHENTMAWRLMYGTYFLYALGFAVLTAICS
jgi:4-hydroxybenzoate polyprenyltransferase